ncbi:uncharacterized protein JCM6883_006031 [Sporobolomyces salmoneus]|uniref:uncharacterized protein n=1 Tax=Sporobolomyces salmoneus TaxID=183962 RepID=UPI0031727AEA
MRLSFISYSFLLPALASALPSSLLEPLDTPSSSSSSLSVSPASSTAETDLYRYQNKVYLIRHGEKGSRGETGLNSKGKKRAKCLRKLLATPRFKIGLILAEEYDHKTHKRRRPYDTVKPIADELGLKVDTECDVEDAKCVRKKVEKYAKAGGKGDVLICWKHSMLNVIAHELGAPKTKPYPDERYDLMWTLHHNRLISKESEQCPGLDPKPRHKKHKFESFDSEEEEEDLDEEEDEVELDWMFGTESTEHGNQFTLNDLD